MEFDTEKFGLVLHEGTRLKHSKRYGVTKQGVLLRVTITTDDRVSIDMVNFGATIANTIASRYRCDTQDQFDFLMYNGPAGRLFNQP